MITLNNEARRHLVEIVKRYGIKIFDEPRKVEDLLMDFCGDCKKEIFIIVSGLKEGASTELLNSSKSGTQKLVIGRLFQRLQDNYAMTEEASIWSIESIAIALGIKSEKESEIKTSNGDELIYVEGGRFVMGDTWGDGYSDEKPTHRVELTYDFYVGKYPVTFEEYDRYCKETGAEKPYDWDRGRGRRPVVSVSWFDAIEYCNWLSEKEGLPIAYYGDGSLLDENRRKTEDITRVKGYRLLTEAEWEYAARGGKKSMGYKYSGSNSPDSVAWYDSNSGDKTHEVGKKKRNELGLYDMSGNVWEWCSDWWGSYSSSAQTNPYNNKAGSNRVYRGGSCYHDATYVRVAFRDYETPTDAGSSRADAGSTLGFRICRTVL